MQSTSGESSRFVIPAGQETVISRMLNPPAGLDGSWKFLRAAIRRDAIDGYYRGPGGERARILLKGKEDAPPNWRRTERFALGLATDAAKPCAAALYRAVLASVRAGEDAFTWQELTHPEPPTLPDQGLDSRPEASATRAGESRDDYAERARIAEGELDLHLDHTPFVDLGIEFDHRGAFAEAMALADRFVIYQSDPRYHVSGWRGLALQALDGDASRVATTDEDAGAYQDQSRYRLTDVAERCPITMSILERLLDFANCRTVAFLMLEPGARISVHVDGEGPPVMRSLNVALNMPEGCRLVIDSNPDGSDNPYTRTVPFYEGSAFLLNVAKYHLAVNDSDEPRIHVIARGSLRLPVPRLVSLAEAQDGLVGIPAVQEALAVKRRALGTEANGSEPPAPVPAEDSNEGTADEILSPFVSTLAAHARERLLALVGLGDHALSARIGPVTNGSSDWRAEVDVRLPTGDTTLLDFQAASPDRPAWFSTAHFACSYRAGSSDPLRDKRNEAFLGAVRERLTRLDPPPPAKSSAEVSALLDALERYRPYLPIRDEDYRIVFLGSQNPIGIIWLGFHCNQDCRMCWQGRNWPAPPDEMFDRWLDELCAAPVSSLILSGGEPTLHPRLPEWLRRAALAKVQVTLETNAIRFNEPGFLDSLREAGLASTAISLHAADAEVSDALTMTPGSFALTIAGIRAALAAGLDVGIHCVVEHRNANGLEAHARFIATELREGGSRISRVAYSFPIGYRRRELYQDAIVPLDELRPQLSAAVRILRDAQIDVHFLGTSGFTPCAFDDPTSILEMLPQTVSDDTRADRTYVEPCSSCSVQHRCLGVHTTYAQAHGARGVEPIR